MREPGKLGLLFDSSPSSKKVTSFGSNQLFQQIWGFFLKGFATNEQLHLKTVIHKQNFQRKDNPKTQILCNKKVYLREKVFTRE